MEAVASERVDLNASDAITLGRDLFAAHRFDEAERLFNAAEQAGAGFVAINARGLCLAELHRHAEALQQFDKGFSVLRDEMSALMANRAKALCDLGREAEAMEIYNGLLRVMPGNALLLYNRALVLLQSGQFEDAIREFEIVLALEPYNDKARFGRGFANLVLGNYAAGFQDYECRLKDDILEPDAPLWDGSQDITGKTVLVMGDMGLGDCIMFLRYVPLMVARGARVIVAMDPVVRPLAAQIDGVEVVTEDRAAWPPLDYWVRAMSLAYAFKTVRSNVPVPLPLKFDEEKLAKWRAKIGGKNKLKVGICWTGSTRSKYDSHRSMRLDDLIPLLKLSGIQFYSLQLDVRDCDKATFHGPQAANLVDLSRHFTDFVETAHAMKCLDVVLTVDTSVAHMAGTVGVPTWVMLTAYRTYWLWIQQLATSPWYPSVRVFRQASDGDWPGLIAEIADRLAHLVRAKAA